MDILGRNKNTAFVVAATVSVLFIILNVARYNGRDSHSKISAKLVGGLPIPKKQPLLPSSYNLTLIPLDSYKERIVIGSVICSKEGDTRFRDKAVVMIKSVVISAQIYKISKVHFHLFIEYLEDGAYLLEKINSFSSSIENSVEIEVDFHSPVNATVEKYRQDMLYKDEQFRCQYVRIFFSTALPNVDSLIYLDTDTMITGNLANFWEIQKLHMKGRQQMIAIGRDNEPYNPYWDDIYRERFDLPHPVKKGLNSGVLLMNLTKMREYGWEEKLLNLYDNYILTGKMYDQKLINLMLYYDPGIYYVLPCQFNYMRVHCLKGLYCEGVERDPYGIQVLHGAGGNVKAGGTFRQLFLIYQQVNLTANVMDYVTSVMLPGKEAYGLLPESEEEIDENVNDGAGIRNHGKCDGSLDKLLFKNLIL